MADVSAFGIEMSDGGRAWGHAGLTAWHFLRHLSVIANGRDNSDEIAPPGEIAPVMQDVLDRLEGEGGKAPPRRVHRQVVFLHKPPGRCSITKYSTLSYVWAGSWANSVNSWEWQSPESVAG